MRFILSSLIVFSILSCGKESPVVADPVISFTLTVTSGVGGSVSSPGGKYESGTEITITATPNQGYVFTGWSNGSNSNPIIINVNSNLEINPQFEQAIVSRLEMSLDQNNVLMGEETNFTYMAFDQNDAPLPDAIPTLSLSDSLFGRIENQRIITEYDGLLTIYGRINEVVDSIQLDIQPDYNNWKTFYRPIENGLPDLSEVCDNGGNCANTNSVKIDLNNDGKQDLLMHFFKDRYPLNQPYDGPSFNRLVALVSNQDNVLENKTFEVFGSNIVDLSGGLSRNHKIYDLNQDGYMDVVFALNREDGRTCCDTWDTQSVAVISNGDGSYRSESFGIEGFFHDVDIHKDNNGDISIIIGNDDWPTDNNRNFHSYKYNGNSFSPYTTIVQNRDGGSISSYEDDNGIVKYLVSSKDNLGGLDFYENYGSGLSKKKEFSWGYDFEINYTDWMGDSNPTQVKSYNGNTFIGGGFWDSVFLKLSPNETPISIIHYAGNFYSGELSQGDVLTNEQTNLISKMFAFDTSLSSNELPIFTNNGIHQENVNFIEVMDVNNDGYDDVVKYPYRHEGKPIVYINNTSGSFTELTNSNVFPSNIDFVDTSQFIDINGDGILDIIFRHSGTSNEYIQPLLFIGRKPLIN
ncbi:VCBS repeat-containing protein [Flavobacteriaceae bacterium]|nr:VCBS repeat-containing protein [Flavobacteriaceae bacterium]